MAKDAKTYQESEIAEIYNKLKPVEASRLIGEWTGGDLDTGHVAHQTLEQMKWAGKSFRSVDDVDPIMIYNDNGQRVWNDSYGHAVVSFTVWLP